MSCLEAFQSYGLRALGLGERLLPQSDFTLCQQIALIGSGMMWNIYFAVLATAFGFIVATLIALSKANAHPLLRHPANAFILTFRGSPLFIQFFFAYYSFLFLKQAGIMPWLTSAQAGALVVLILNTSAYSAQIFYGALISVPKSEIEAADAFALCGWPRFARIIWPSTLRLAWPAYTNEAIFLFHATALVFLSGFPTWQQRGDAMYYAGYFAQKTFNPFVSYPIMAAYFILGTLCIIALFNLLNRRLNKHLPQAPRLRYRPNFIR